MFGQGQGSTYKLSSEINFSNGNIDFSSSYNYTSKVILTHSSAKYRDHRKFINIFVKQAVDWCFQTSKFLLNTYIWRILDYD